MKKVVLSVFMILFICSLSFAQYNLNGKVTNADNNEFLSGANIKIIELNIGTSSDKNGDFKFKNLTKGYYTLEISYVGFESKKMKIRLQKDVHKKIRLLPNPVELKTTIITATRTNLDPENAAVKSDIITKEQIASYPANSTDELLSTIPNMVINRSWGVFSKNSSVTMRGMDASARTLILLNGTPLNKTAGGTIVWDMINPESIEKIEVVKGPGSAIYGNNAMGGIVNIITKTPDNQKISGSASTFAGTYNYFGGRLSVGQKLNLGTKKWFWQLHSSYNKGDGYILEPKESRDEYDTKAYVEELNVNLKSGIEFNNNNKLTFEYSFHDGKHGAGTKIEEADGAYDHYFTNLLSGKYYGNLNGFEINANVFTQWQDYNKVDESISTKNGYRLSNTFTNTQDYGLYINISKTYGKHRLLWGVDVKNGKLNARNSYFTSSDRLDYQGEMFFYGIFLQDEINLVQNKLRAILGVRIDHAKFSNAFLNVTDPTKATGFAETELINFDGNNWSEFSPRVSLLWKLTENSSLYTSYTTGFMPPKLDDMVRSGVVTKGYKMANPELKPETITNLEIGGRFTITKKLNFEPAVYYSWAKDMVYFIETGEEIVTSGNKLKPILQKRNISKVEIYGFEASLKYKFSDQLNFMGAYTYNHSTIKKFFDEDTSQDFEGKFLIEVPKHQVSLSAYWKNKIADLSVIYNFMDRQWYDDLNTEYIKSYHTLDMKLVKVITNNLSANLSVQNILDDAIVDRKGLLSPGRFVLLELKYKF